MNGDATQPLKLTLTDLQGTDYAVPALWDPRFKVLLDNDAGIGQRLGRIEDGSRPARTLSALASVTALRAYVGAVPGEVAYVDGIGVYRYYPGANEAENAPWTIRPDNNLGRWRIDMIPRSLLGAPNGAASLDANGFLNQSLKDFSVTASKLAENAVNVGNLGNVTVNDTVRLTVNTAALMQVVSGLANRVKAVTGKGAWSEDPAVTLETLNSKGVRTDRSQTFEQAQTMGTLTITGDLILPVR